MRIVLEIRETGPNSFAGSACEGRYGAIDKSPEATAAALRQRLPVELREDVEIRLVSQPKPGPTPPWNGGDPGDLPRAML